MAEDMRPRGLGRGLSTLIGEEAAPTRGETRGSRIMPTAFLRPNRFQPRKHFAEDDLNDLVQSVKEKGILQPILVRPIVGDHNAFEIVAGERRWRAAQLAKLHDIPVIVRELSDGEALEVALIENIQRSDLNAIEEAAAYHELTDRFGYTQEKVAGEVGKSRSHVANTLRLLKLPESVKAMVRDGRLTAGHARTLIGVADPEARAREILVGAMNVREAEQRLQNTKRKTHDQSVDDPNTKALEASISNALGLKVHILHKGDKGGEVRISYKSLEQLDDLIHRLKVGL
ncbi:MAG: ParB/RepB/Spo0J family partition protein [Alphaproteobacteria bacterium]|nr:ParB/RepB/Spo0J family partition protein [Alphaproteobacteria bacterium]MDE2630126.1 ParB/RepB/Spo0J family partition protein [Alphaproteobacteria bacterium]